jgi:2'-5' RNA ligase
MMQPPIPIQFALVLTFDQQLQERIELLITKLEEQGLTPFPEGMRVSPHITLAAFTFPSGQKGAPENISQPGALPPDFSGSLVDMALRSTPIEISLESLGAFNSNQGVIFLAPVVTYQLQSIHTEVQRLLSRYGAALNPYYRPGQWVPHVTITVEQPPEVLPLVFRICQQTQAFSSGYAQNLLLVDFPPPRQLAAYRLGEGTALATGQSAL